MPAPPGFVESIENAVRSRGAVVHEAPNPEEAPNPFNFTFEGRFGLQRALIHVRRVTPQHGEGTDHGRPPGEWHSQMIFDDSRRGAGERNQLQVAEGYQTVLLGYAVVDGAPVIAAWDAGRKADYAYSRSLQIKDDTLLDALQGGIAQQKVRGGEVVVAFRPEFFAEYLKDYENYHSQVVEGRPTTSTGEDRPRSTTSRGIIPPDDFFGPRDRVPASGSRLARDVRFRAYISDHYDHCAICGFGEEAALEAAHIVPVGDGGSDHPSNGFRLCRNCHALFDAGLLLVTPNYQIELASAFLTSGRDAQRYDNVNRLQIPEMPEEYRPDPEKLRAVYEERREH